MRPIQIIRMQLLAVVIAILEVLPSGAAPDKHVVFHNSIPSNLYVNAAQGPVHIKDDPEGKTEIIKLVLYPADKRSRAPKTASVVINSGGASGVIALRQDNPPVGPTFIAGTLAGLKPGKNGFKIYEFGDIEDECSWVGDVYNPYKLDPKTAALRRKTGDLGFIMANRRGKAKFAMSDPIVSLVGPRSVIGRSLVITDEESVSENGVAKIGCGVIGFAQ